jgi:hypothetical protein
VRIDDIPHDFLVSVDMSGTRLAFVVRVDSIFLACISLLKWNAI